MNTQLATINNKEISIKEYQGKRVITFNDIDLVHNRPEGTASRNFRTNKKHLLNEIDYYRVCPDEIRRNKIFEISNKVQSNIVLLTESGYLMLAKSLTDDLAWDVQRQLVNGYFKLQTVINKNIDNYQLRILELQNELNDTKKMLMTIGNNQELFMKKAEKALSLIYKTILNNVNDIKTNVTPQQQVDVDNRLWKAKIYRLAGELVKPNGYFDTCEAVLSNIYMIMRNKYGIVWEQEVKDYMYKYDCGKPSTIAIVSENEMYKSIMQSILVDMVDAHDKTNRYNEVDIDSWESAQKYILSLAEKLNDNTPNAAHTYRTIYKLMSENSNVNWDSYIKRYKRETKSKSLPTKKVIVSVKPRLQKIFITELNNYKNNIAL